MDLIISHGACAEFSLALIHPHPLNIVFLEPATLNAFQMGIHGRSVQLSEPEVGEAFCGEDGTPERLRSDGKC